MADKETEEWAKKTRAIEAERAKAAREVEKEQSSKVNVSYLDPRLTKVKGFSRDPNVIRANTERMADRSVIFAIGGVVLNIIGRVGAMVATTSRLGAAGAMIAGLPEAIGMFGMGLAVLMALISGGSEVVFKLKYGRKLGAAFWSAVGAIATVAIYQIVSALITSF